MRGWTFSSAGFCADGLSRRRALAVVGKRNKAREERGKKHARSEERSAEGSFICKQYESATICRDRQLRKGALMTEKKPLVAADATLEQIRDQFKNDRYATESLGAVIEEAREGYARVSMEVGLQHRNAMGAVMGGVYFTLGDYSFAIASNVGQPPTVSVNNSIDYLTAAKGDRLVAECHMEKAGRAMCFARIDVRDGEGRLCARMNVTGARV